MKIGFVLSSPVSSPLPSTRISVLNMLPFLSRAGFDATIAFEPPESSEQPDVSGLASKLIGEGVDIAYFQKVHGPSVLREVRNLTSAGVRCIFGVCDLVISDMTEATNATIVVTEYLRDLYPQSLRSKVHVVHDGIEDGSAFKTSYGVSANRGRKVKAVLVTSSELSALPSIGKPPSFVDVTVVGCYPPERTLLDQARHLRDRLQEPPWLSAKVRALSQIAYPGFRKVDWSLERAYRIMLDSDVGIIPVDMTPRKWPGQPASPWQVKSENRLTMKMALGLPVVTSPVPSYLDILQDGVNGFIALNRPDWRRALDRLRNPELRERIGRNARECVVQRFSQVAQARKLVDVLHAVANRRHGDS